MITSVAVLFTYVDIQCIPMTIEKVRFINLENLIKNYMHQLL